MATGGRAELLNAGPVTVKQASRDPSRSRMHRETIRSAVVHAGLTFGRSLDNVRASTADAGERR